MGISHQVRVFKIVCSSCTILIQHIRCRPFDSLSISFPDADANGHIRLPSHVATFFTAPEPEDKSDRGRLFAMRNTILVFINYKKNSSFVPRPPPTLAESFDYNLISMEVMANTYKEQLALLEYANAESKKLHMIFRSEVQDGILPFQHRMPRSLLPDSTLPLTVNQVTDDMMNELSPEMEPFIKVFTSSAQRAWEVESTHLGQYLGDCAIVSNDQHEANQKKCAWCTTSPLWKEDTLRFVSVDKLEPVASSEHGHDSDEESIQDSLGSSSEG